MSNIKNINRDAALYPKYYQAMLRLIHRIRQATLEERGSDYWAELTDEEVFWTWANKRGINYTRQAKREPTLPFGTGTFDEP